MANATISDAMFPVIM